MKKIVPIMFLSTLALVAAACGGSAGAPLANSEGGSSGASSGPTVSAPSAPLNGTPSSGPSALQLAAGMLKLEGTTNAVTAQEASQLLPLWKSLQQIESASAPMGTPGARPNSAMMQQVSAQVAVIQNAMPPAQIQAIIAMNLSRQDIFTAFQEADITIGGPGGGPGGFQPNGGTFTPPASGTPGAFGGNGGFGQGGTPRAGGPRQGFGNFIPPSVVNGIVQFLQKKAGS